MTTAVCGELRDIANKNSSEIDVHVIFLPVKRRDALNKNSSGTNFRGSPAGEKRRDALIKTMVHLNRSPEAVRLHGCTRSSNAGAVAEQVHSMSDSLLECRSDPLEVGK